MAARGDEGDEDDALDSAEWSSVAKSVYPELEAVARSGSSETLTILGVSDDQSITSQTFTKAVEAAKARAAELVGKSWDEDGKLVDNPDADMAITDTLRDEIRSAVADAIESGDSAAELSDRIESLAGFSEERATLIARSEIVSSHARGQMTAMRESGVVEQKAWSTAGEDVCDECQANEDQGAIGLEDDFESGDDAPIAHPGCRCVVVAYVPESAAADDDEEEDSESDE